MVVERCKYVYRKEKQFERKSTFIFPVRGKVRCSFGLTLRGTVSTNSGKPANSYISGRNSTGELRAVPIGCHNQEITATSNIVIGGSAAVLYPTVYYENFQVIGCFHNYDAHHTVFWRYVEVDLLRMAGSLRTEGCMSYPQIFNYMEGSLGITLCHDSMHRRLRYRSDQNLPGSKDSTRLI